MKTSNFLRWLRVVLPADAVLWLMLGAVLAAWLVQQVVVLSIRFVAASELTAAEASMGKTPIHPIVALFVATLYGVCRVLSSHPVLNKGYGTWLARTPWRFPDPLPLGPLRLVGQDAAVIGLLLAIGLLPPWGNLEILPALPLVFVFAYCGTLAYAHLKLETYGSLAALVALVGCGLLAVAYPPAFVLVAAAMLGVSYFAMSSSLRDFPYTASVRENLGLVIDDARPPVNIYLPIAPDQFNTRFVRLNPVSISVISVLAGWLMFCIANLPIPELELRPLFWIHLGACLIVAAARLLSYIYGRFPPISLLGRIATRKYIVPGYDVVFVAPLAATATALLLPQLLLAIGFGPSIAVPLSTAASIWLALALPPSRETWQYTGHFRMLTSVVSTKDQPAVRA